MNLKRSNKTKVEGGMSSMTDLVFLMLIFFIIMSTMANSTLPVDLPSGKNSTPSSVTSPVEVGIDAENNYFIDSEKSRFYTLEELIPILEAKISEQSIPTLKISGDKTANYETIFNLIAISKQKGWKPVLSYSI